jgi:hypothetical protein
VSLLNTLRAAVDKMDWDWLLAIAPFLAALVVAIKEIIAFWVAKHGETRRKLEEKMLENAIEEKEKEKMLVDQPLAQDRSLGPRCQVPHTIRSSLGSPA